MTLPMCDVIMMSLGLYSCMAETDNKVLRVNIKIWGGVLVQIPSFMPIGTTVIESRKFKKRKNNMDKIGKSKVEVKSKK